jgi:ABC-type multidrug transport system fused ATPase/permease subunit
MSQEDLHKALERYKADLAFSGGVQQDADGTLKAAGFDLEPDERQQFKKTVGVSNASQRDMLVNPELLGGGMPFYGSPFQPPPAMVKEYWEEQYQNMRTMGALRRSLSEKSIEVVKKTFDRAGATYSSITWMNRIMFAVGIGLILYAAYLATTTHAQVYSLLFGGLGAANFIALFMLKPIESTQKALANLVQVQVTFMTYFDQISWWENFAQMGISTFPPDLSKIERASDGLQKRTLETLELLQRFVEEAKQPALQHNGGDPRKQDSPPATK